MLIQEKDAAVAEQASTAELLEVSQRKVAEAETRCRLLEEQSSILRQEVLVQIQTWRFGRGYERVVYFLWP